MRRDKEGKGNGKVSIDIEDRKVTVGRRYGMKVTYTAGQLGVNVGGSLRFRLPGFEPFPPTIPLPIDELFFLRIECSNPRTHLRASNNLPYLDGKDGREFFLGDYLFITICREPLKEGDTVSVYYGYNHLPKNARALTHAQEYTVEVATDLDGKRNAPGSGFCLVENPPTIHFISDSAVKLETTIASTTIIGEPFEVTVRARDRYNNVATGYRGRVILKSKDESALSRSYVFKSEDQGVHIFKDIMFRNAGINRVIALDEGYGLYGRSNPSKTTTQNPKYQLYWGDTHVHSYISADSIAEGMMVTPAEAYVYARNVSDLDFCMITDHDQNISEDEWRETQEAARDGYEPGQFVTFSGWEASHGEFRKGGDRNIYYFTDDQPLFNHGSTKEVFDKLKGRKAMVIPHIHEGTDWSLHDPELERVTEIYSHWGCGLSRETEPRMIPACLLRFRPEDYVHYALDKGVKVGFIASADHSLGHPGDDFWWSLSNYQGGLAAVYATSLTREGIWEALWARRCYATTRARILLGFKVNGHFMGEEFTLKPDRTRRLSINVSGTTSIEKVEIIKNGKVVHTRSDGKALDISLAYVDKEPERPTDYYYVQVTQVDGERAWSSPIWITQE